MVSLEILKIKVKYFVGEFIFEVKKVLNEVFSL